MLPVNNFGLGGGLSSGGMAGIQNQLGQGMADYLAYQRRLLMQSAVGPVIDKPKTIRQKLQAETDEWLEGVFE